MKLEARRLVTLCRGHLAGGRSQTRTQDLNSQSFAFGTFPRVAAPAASTQLPGQKLPSSSTRSLTSSFPKTLVRAIQSPPGRVRAFPAAELPGRAVPPPLSSRFHPQTHRSRRTPLCPEVTLPGSSAQAATREPSKAFRYSRRPRRNVPTASSGGCRSRAFLGGGNPS